MSRFEVFHRIDDPASARVRRRVLALGLGESAEFRNVAFESHRDALTALGGAAVPAIWDGAALWSGEAACESFFQRAAA